MLDAYAKELLKNSTTSELLLWKKINQLSLDIAFYRKVPLLDFIVDFYSPALQLAIEIDENYHDYKYGKEHKKQGMLESHGVQFLRFSELEIAKNSIDFEKVLKEKIDNILDKATADTKVNIASLEQKKPLSTHLQVHTNKSKNNNQSETSTKKFSLSKKEKLKSKKIFEELFAKGKSVSSYPLKLIYIKSALVKDLHIQTGVTVSKRKFKSAVDRNRIKRLLRESYRLNKHIVFNNIEGKFAFLILYLGSEMPTYEAISLQMPKLLTLFLGKIKSGNKI